MMQLLRDEHGLVADMVKVQLATERGELHSQRADPTSASIASPQSNGRSLTARGRRTI
jgi:hypothetical protein